MVKVKMNPEDSEVETVFEVGLHLCAKGGRERKEIALLNWIPDLGRG